MAGVSAPGFWSDLYARGGDGWDLGQPSPPLVEFLDHTPLAPGRVAVAGCGRGHDARHLTRRGHAVVGFDFSAAAIAEARALARSDGGAAEFVERDIFTLAFDYERAFDGVWEYTCFCAIDPKAAGRVRPGLGQILRPGGWLLACFFPMRPGVAGPPFPVSGREVRRLFTPGFRLERAYRPRSVRPRQGQEWMVLFRRTGAPA